MSKRKPMDKTQARERRNRLLETAAAAELSLTEGVREMRAIAGMTQEEFARHREVSARVIKAIELGQGNPTVGTLNRIGHFFGLEVAFVPVRRAAVAAEQKRSPVETAESSDSHIVLGMTAAAWLQTMKNIQESINTNAEMLSEAFKKIEDIDPEMLSKALKDVEGKEDLQTSQGEAKDKPRPTSVIDSTPRRKKKHQG